MLEVLSEQEWWCYIYNLRANIIPRHLYGIVAPPITLQGKIKYDQSNKPKI